MNTDNDNKVVIIEHRKTFAPVILAIIAFVLWIPSLLCNVICASAMQEMTNGRGGSSLFLPSILGLVVFALCFFCKSKWSTLTGVFVILLALLMGIVNVIILNPLALISAILYIIAGALSIANTKRVA